MCKMIMYSKGRNDETYADVKSDVFVAGAGSCGMGTWAMGLGRLTPLIIWLVVP